MWLEFWGLQKTEVGIWEALMDLELEETGAGGWRQVKSEEQVAREAGVAGLISPTPEEHKLELVIGNDGG